MPLLATVLAFTGCGPSGTRADRDPSPPPAAAQARGLVDAAAATDDRERSLDRLREALAALPGELDEHAMATLAALVDLAREHDDAETARRALERMLAHLEEHREHTDVDLRNTRLELAGLVARDGDDESAAVLYRHALEGAVLAGDGARPETQAVRLSLALAARRLGDAEAARRHLESALEHLEDRVGEDDPVLRETRGVLAGVVAAEGDLPRARALLEGAVAAAERTLPERDPALLGHRRRLADVLSRLGNPVGAWHQHRQVLAALESKLAATHPQLVAVQQDMIGELRAAGEVTAALDVVTSLLETLTAGDTSGGRAVSRLVAVRARLLLDAGRDAEALELLERWSAAADDPAVGPLLHEAHAEALVAAGRTEAALDILSAQLAATRDRLGPEHPATDQARSTLAGSLLRAGRAAEARTLFETILSHQEALPSDHPWRRGASADLVRALAALGDESALTARWAELHDAVRARLVAMLPALGPLDDRAADELAPDLATLLELADRVERPAGDTLALVETLAALRVEPPPPLAEPVHRHEAEAHVRHVDDLVRARAVDPEARAGELAAAVAERDRQLAAWRERLPSDWSLPLSGAATLGLVDPGEAAVSLRRYARSAGDEGLVLHVVTPTRTVRHELGPARRVDDWIAAWTGEADPAAGRALAEHVLAPILGAAADADRLVVAGLDALALGHLPLGDGRLGDRVEVWRVPHLAPSRDAGASDATSGRRADGGLDWLVAVDAAPHALVADALPWASLLCATPAVPDPVRDGRRVDVRRDPPRRAALESTCARWVETGDAILLRGEDVTKGALAREAPRARRMVLALDCWEHAGGVATTRPASPSPRRPPPDASRVAIACAGAARGLDSLSRAPGLLTAAELAHLDLDAVELAVLASDGASPAARAMLREALHAAGVEKVLVVPPRRVDPEADAHLTGLMRAIHDGSDPATALGEVLAGTPTHVAAGWSLSG